MFFVWIFLSPSPFSIFLNSGNYAWVNNRNIFIWGKSNKSFYYESISQDTTVLVLDDSSEKMTFQILDICGRVLSLNTMPKGTFSFPVNIDNLTSGSYFIRFYSSDILISQKKLVISK